MNTQNENHKSQNIERQNEPISEMPRSIEHCETMTERQLSVEQCAKMSEKQHSGAPWQQLEHLLEQKSSKIPLFAQEKNKDMRLFVGGVIASFAFLAACECGVNLYNTAVEHSVFAPAATVITQAISQVALHAQKSTLTGIVDPDTLTASLYWTIDLKNISGSDQEATAELTLPPRAVVSRATLWVNGVPQEASFNTTAQVAQAYNWITVQHRDPLLITYKDEHTVMIKASPVPANGDIMKIRLGITAPLSVGSDGMGVLTVPQIKQANFSPAERNEVHIESKQQLTARGDILLNETRTLKSNYLLAANLPPSDFEKVAIVSAFSPGKENFAIRATHSLPGTYIFSQVKDDSDDQEVQLSRSQNIPKCRVIKSEQAAHRVSTLWAAHEIARLLAQGKRTEAEDLASVYRIVSPVSGAVVLEYDSDYTRNGLARDQYMVSVPGKRPIASKYPLTTSIYSQLNNGNAPVLQGATNGTIAPQGGDAFVLHGPVSGVANWLVASSRDAALFGGAPPTVSIAPFNGAGPVIQGVNTAGTVRVNNLANLEAWIAMVANACDIGFFVAALFFALRGLRKMVSSGLKAGIKDQLIAVSLVCCGTLWLVALPFMAAFKLVKLAGRKLAGRKLAGGTLAGGTLAGGTLAGGTPSGSKLAGGNAS